MSSSTFSILSGSWVLSTPEGHESVKLFTDSDCLAWIILDRDEKSVNVMDVQFTNEFNAVLDHVESLVKRGDILGVVVFSTKSSFIVGADVRMIYPVTDAETGKKIARNGQDLCSRLESLSVPSIACINGNCLGGGLELALACSSRVCSRTAKGQIGLPEVKLGLLPGAGGTIRLPKLIGIQNALSIILAGGSVKPDKAKKLGLVDALLDGEDRYPGEERFLLECRSYIVPLLDRPVRRRQFQPGWKDWLLERNVFGRMLIEHLSRQQLDKTTRRNYPAPYLALDSVLFGAGSSSLQKSFENEARLFGYLVHSAESKNLIQLFFLSEMSKKIPLRKAVPLKVSKVGVIGAGVMGSAIAQLLAARKFRVYMRDIKPEFVENGMNNVKKLFDGLVTKKRLSSADAEAGVRRVEAGTDFDGFRDCDVIIEAAVERMDLKMRILQECQEYMSSHCLFATNTSSLSVTELASVAHNPSNILGMHFFNPVSKMPLVEVVRGQQSSENAVATIYQLSLDLGKTPIICADAPGFVVNRILGLYMGEAGHLIRDGAKIEVVDRAIVGFGMPMGPFRLIDEVGIDVGSHIGPVLHKGLGDRFESFDALPKMAAANLLGCKSGKGFYHYDSKGKAEGLEPSLDQVLGSMYKKEGSSSVSEKDIVDRCILNMVNEAARVLEDNIVRTPDELDLAMVMGTGFAPFRGGPLAYADACGVDNTVRRLQVLESKYGKRFSPCSRLLDMAAQGKKFFPHRVEYASLQPIGETLQGSLRAKL